MLPLGTIKQGLQLGTECTYLNSVQKKSFLSLLGHLTCYKQYRDTNDTIFETLHPMLSHEAMKNEDNNDDDNNYDDEEGDYDDKLIKIAITQPIFE